MKTNIVRVALILAVVTLMLLVMNIPWKVVK
jgi:hypothetical protein